MQFWIGESRMVILSFLGTSKYEKTKYKYRDKIVDTNHFSYAISEFIKPDELIVIMTSKAENSNYNELKNLCSFTPIRIPDGNSEDEFWMIFDKITSVVKNDEEVIFDITHGFRSQPFLVIVLLQYLKVIKNIKIANILYGAFEAKDDNNITPVFELKSFIELLEWTNAAREFLDNGNMKYFKNMLSKIHKYSHLHELEKPAQQLLNVGKDLDKLTDAFDIIRLNEIFSTTSVFILRLNGLLTDIENHPKTKPFKVLLEKIVNQFSPISAADKNLFSANGFDAQKAIINWYIETNKYQKAITLAREYIISKYMVEIHAFDETSLLNKESRYEAEEELGKLLALLRNGTKIKNRNGNYANIWTKITEARNDINHAGMRSKPKHSSKLIKSIINITETINKEF